MLVASHDPGKPRVTALVGRVLVIRTQVIRCACGHDEPHGIPANYPPLQATLDMLRVANGRCNRCERGLR